MLETRVGSIRIIVIEVRVFIVWFSLLDIIVAKLFAVLSVILAYIFTVSSPCFVSSRTSSISSSSSSVSLNIFLLFSFSITK